MSGYAIEQIKMEASSKSINKWTTIIAKETGVKVEGDSPTERMWFVIGQLRRKRGMNLKERKKARKQLQRKWDELDWMDYQPWR